jgi:enoyl-CoA hydratase
MTTVTYEVIDRVARVTLTRPDCLNAVNRTLIREVNEAFGRIAVDDDVRAVVLAGQGRAFCAGADLKDPETHSADDVLATLAGDGLDAVAACRKPVIAAVQGYAVGAGVEMVIAADIAIAAESAVFFLPQVALGIVPGAGGLSRLVRCVGEAWTTRMALLGEKIDAERALQIGLVTEVVSESQLEERSLAIATALADQPHIAVRLAKESIAEASDLPLSAALRTDKYRLFALSSSNEKEELHAAFGTRKRSGTS